MNWGHKIIVVYVLFVAGMGFLAYKASTQNKDLVTEDYYAKELVYQQKIDQSKRASALSASVQIKMINNALVVSFPNDFATKQVKGDVVLYCPSDEKKDMQKLFSVTDSAVELKVPAHYHGLYYVKINWEVEGISYYHEEKIII